MDAARTSRVGRRAMRGRWAGSVTVPPDRGRGLLACEARYDASRSASDLPNLTPDSDDI
jgi:hypothetical protein